MGYAMKWIRLWGWAMFRLVPLLLLIFLSHISRSSNVVNSGKCFPTQCPTQWVSNSFIINFLPCSDSSFQNSSYFNFVFVLLSFHLLVITRSLNYWPHLILSGCFQNNMLNFLWFYLDSRLLVNIINRLNFITIICLNIAGNNSNNLNLYIDIFILLKKKKTFKIQICNNLNWLFCCRILFETGNNEKWENNEIHNCSVKRGVEQCLRLWMCGCGCVP